MEMLWETPFHQPALYHHEYGAMINSGEYNGMDSEEFKRALAGFEIATTLSRTDYGIVWNKALETGGFLLGDEVEVTVNLEVARK